MCWCFGAFFVSCYTQIRTYSFMFLKKYIYIYTFSDHGRKIHLIWPGQWWTCFSTVLRESALVMYNNFSTMWVSWIHLTSYWLSWILLALQCLDWSGERSFSIWGCEFDSCLTNLLFHLQDHCCSWVPLLTCWKQLSGEKNLVPTPK